MARTTATDAPDGEGTLRQRLVEHLRGTRLTARELSSLVGIRERDVEAHLEHVRRSLERSEESLVVDPAQCRACGFRFTKRDRLDRPGSCPRCKEQRISAPAFEVQAR